MRDQHVRRLPRKIERDPIFRPRNLLFQPALDRGNDAASVFFHFRTSQFYEVTLRLQGTKMLFCSGERAP
jgi:hypothetical protein